MKECYLPIDVNGIYPLRGHLEHYLYDWPEKRMDKMFDIALLNPELVNFFQSKDVKIRENFIMWHWNIPGPKWPHTDGDWFSTGHHVKKRLCGVNWNFSPGTYVEFYSTEGGNPEFSYRGEYDFSTTWKDTDKVIDVWDGQGPVIINPQIPHNVKGTDGVKKRLSITLRFYETYESLMQKLA